MTDLLKRAQSWLESDPDPETRAELGRLVNCKLWGPGRFGRALRVATREGRIAHPRRGHYGPVG